MSKSNYNTLYQFFLSRGQYDKIDPEWADENYNLIAKGGYPALMHFFPNRTMQEDRQADEDLEYLKSTCGIGQ